MSARPPLARPIGMSDQDAELLGSARELIRARYREGRHEVAAAFRLADGRIVTGIHVDGSARRSAVCAEGVAAGNAITAADGARVVSAVSVLRRVSGEEHVIEPCGVCAEMLSDHWPDARVWITVGEDTVPSTFAGLLPAKRRRAW